MLGTFTIRLRRGFMILAAVLLNGGILLGIGAILVYLNTGADRSSILHLDTEIESVYRPHIQLGSHTNEGRPIDTAAAENLIRDYLNAWYTRNEALRYNDPLLMRDYYTDSAYAKLKRLIDLNKNSEVSIQQTTLAHSISIDFYSEDGKLATLSDSNVEVYKQIWKKDGLQVESKDTSNYRVVLFLEDNSWRIRHMQRTASERGEETKDLEGRNMANTIAGIKGVNYYPQDQPWNMFGDDFDLKVVESDFVKIREMGLNTIRIFIPYQEFGGPDVRSGHLSQLKQVMDAAETKGIKVLLTLFDFYGNYDLAEWTLNFRHARLIVTAFKEHPALLAWDIKNEPDLDFESRGKKRVLAWLRELSAIVNTLDQEHPVTIGWSNAEAASLLKDEVDVVSFHYYGDTDSFRAAYQELRISVPEKPVVLQEYGLSSYSGIWHLFSGSETEQAAHHEAIQGAVTELQIPYLFWTLYDFPEVPQKVVGRLPWRRMPQKKYGCFDEKGDPKEAYTIIKQK
ncbi:MAG: cellulase family glycosylhydrolase [Flavobacteriaceae bacterium]|nr:cellulase family glycosylhydrolase [Flavobacteriaceae bacterium]